MEFDLSGKWIGFFTYNLDPLPDKESVDNYWFELSIRQEGNEFSGECTDVNRERTSSFAEEYEDAKRNRKALAVLQLFFWAKILPRTRFRSVLPEKSCIRGRIDQTTVEFTKTYDGKLETQIMSSDKSGSVTIETPHVTYLGKLDPTSDSISGTYIVRSGANTTEGRFTMSRKSGDLS